MMICNPGDVVDVPFPFIDTPDKKLRPALVLSAPRFHGISGAIVLMMITSAARSHWETDVELDDWQGSGLRKASILRWKIFTIDEQLVVSKRGSLSNRDQLKVREAFGVNFSHWIEPRMGQGR